MYFGVHLSVHAGPLSTLLDSDPLCIFSLLFLFSYAHWCHVCGVRGAGSGSSGQGGSLKVLWMGLEWFYFSSWPTLAFLNNVSDKILFSPQNMHCCGYRSTLIIHVSSRLADSFFLKFTYFGLCWVFVVTCGPLSSCGVWASRCGGFSHCGAWAREHVGFSNCSSWALRYTLCGCTGLGAALNVKSSQGWDQVSLCLLHWQVDSSPLDRQGSPSTFCLLCNKGCILHESWFQGRSPSYADCSHDFSHPVNKDTVVLGPFSCFTHSSGLQHLWYSCIYLLNFLATSHYAGIWVLRPGTEPTAPVVEAWSQSLDHQGSPCSRTEAVALE